MTALDVRNECVALLESLHGVARVDKGEQRGEDERPDAPAMVTVDLSNGRRIRILIRGTEPSIDHPTRESP